MSAAHPLNTHAFEALARSRIDPGACDEVAGGAGPDSAQHDGFVND
jgi:hypothetical protein